MKGLAFALPLFALAACQPEAAGPAAAPDTGATPVAAAAGLPSDAELLAQGEYLVKIAGCNDCHTPGYFLGKPMPATQVPKILPRSVAMLPAA